MSEEKRSRYDTDPLDPDFARRTENIGGASRETARGEQARHPEMSEEPTRLLDDSLPTSYPSVFVPPVYQPPPANYTTFGSATPPPMTTRLSSPAGADGKDRPSARPVPKLGLPENVAHVLPYAPFYIGLVASLIELVLVPRSEVRTRFHAAQGLALQLAILAISFLFGIVGTFAGTGFGGWLFSMAALIFLVISMVRVWQGEQHRIAPLNDFTKRINEKFEPRK